MLKLKPEILTQPNIPKPLHGLNPRTLLGQKWWDEQRFVAQERTEYRCVACGVPKNKAKGHHWLECHEYWDIDYYTGVCEVISIEPLCHYCHNFIHSGRLYSILGKQKSLKEVKEILEHGFKILSENKLKCFPFTLEFAKSINAKTYGVQSYELPKTYIDWNQWVLKINGRIYKSKFKNYQEWRDYYGH